MLFLLSYYLKPPLIHGCLKVYTKIATEARKLMIFSIKVSSISHSLTRSSHIYIYIHICTRLNLKLLYDFRIRNNEVPYHTIQTDMPCFLHIINSLHKHADCRHFLPLPSDSTRPIWVRSLIPTLMQSRTCDRDFFK